MNPRHAHRSSRLRELVEIVAFFGTLVLVVLFLSLDGIH
jgi:hypothetical protein